MLAVLLALWWYSRVISYTRIGPYHLVWINSWTDSRMFYPNMRQSPPNSKMPSTDLPTRFRHWLDVLFGLAGHAEQDRIFDDLNRRTDENLREFRESTAELIKKLDDRADSA